ncbi:MAG TPA: N(4)-(beta-N-acetylglucosaminyl)-L-asparaginase [Longimicrobiales bacterium]|jgi:N4-(beta-N-acetylglucosaminyl)-L-asparaginase
MAKHPSVDRRDFLRHSVVAGASAAALGRIPDLRAPGPRPAAGVPLLVTSHDNDTGQSAMRAGWNVLTSGGSALDAIERAANIIEDDPEDISVGYGGLPNWNGVVQLDACIMDGRTYNAGAVASLENIRYASSVARLVMERTDHVMMVGPGALEFARSWGMREEDLLTERARATWLRWRERLSDSDAWGPPVHLRDGADPAATGPLDGEPDSTTGTTNVLAVDPDGNVAGLTTTSGMSWKIPGRVGDSPIIGAGLYVDNDVGAAGATGRGEDVIKSCASYFIVGRMREGRSPQQACEDACEMIVGRYHAIGSDYIPSEKFVAINRAGEYGCSQMPLSGQPAMSVRHAGGLEIYRGSGLYG